MCPSPRFPGCSTATPRYRRRSGSGCWPAPGSTITSSNALAKGLTGGPTHLLGVLVTDISNGFFADLAKEIETAARERGYSILLFNSDYDPDREQEYLDVVRRYRVDGVLAVPIRETSPQWYDYVQRLDVPVVTITRRAEGLDSFYADHAAAGARVAAYLAGQGYERFLFIGKDYDGKYVGFRRWLEEEGKGDAVTNRVLAGHEDFRRELAHWLAQDSRRAAVFAGNDIYALQALDILRALGVSVPGQVGGHGIRRHLHGAVSQPPAVHRAAAHRPKWPGMPSQWLLDRIEHPGPRPPELRALRRRAGAAGKHLNSPFPRENAGVFSVVVNTYSQSGFSTV